MEHELVSGEGSRGFPNGGPYSLPVLLDARLPDISRRRTSWKPAKVAVLLAAMVQPVHSVLYPTALVMLFTVSLQYVQLYMRPLPANTH